MAEGEGPGWGASFRQAARALTYTPKRGPLAGRTFATQQDAQNELAYQRGYRGASGGKQGAYAASRKAREAAPREPGHFRLTPPPPPREQGAIERAIRRIRSNKLLLRVKLRTQSYVYSVGEGLRAGGSDEPREFWVSLVVPRSEALRAFLPDHSEERWVIEYLLPAVFNDEDSKELIADMTEDGGDVAIVDFEVTGYKGEES